MGNILKDSANRASKYGKKVIGRGSKDERPSPGKDKYGQEIPAYLSPEQQRKMREAGEAEFERENPTDPRVQADGDSKYGFAPPPVRQQTYGPDGMLLPQYQLDVGKERDITQMGQLEMQRQRELLNSNIGEMYGRNQSAQADAMGRLAATQGLSGGAAERIGTQGNRANQSALQQMYGGHQQNMLGIRTQDIGRQIQGDQYNIGNNLSEIQRQYQGDLQGYDIGAKIHSGEIMADAIGQGGGGGGGAGMFKPFTDMLGVTQGQFQNFQPGQSTQNPQGQYPQQGQGTPMQNNYGTQQPQGGGYQANLPTAGYQGGMGQQGGGSQFSLYGSPGQTTNPNQNQGFSMQG